MIKNIFKNKDLVVFWTAVIIAACDLLPLERLTIPEVTAAPSNFGSQVVSMNERPWLEHQEYVLLDQTMAIQKNSSNGLGKSAVNISYQPLELK